jgi:hypothetical protein
MNRLSTSISFALLDEKTGLGQGTFSGPVSPSTIAMMTGAIPLGTAFCHGRGSIGAAAGRGEIPASQTTIRGVLQCAT